MLFATRFDTVSDNAFITSVDNVSDVIFVAFKMTVVIAELNAAIAASVVSS